MALTALEALQRIQSELCRSRADVVPSGWKTVAQWTDESGMSQANTARLLVRGVKAGLIEAQHFTVAYDSTYRKVKHYRAIEDASKKGKK